MVEPVERFTEAARDALANAGQRARELGHQEIATEHLLLGLLAVPGGALREIAAADVFFHLGVAAWELRGALESALIRGPGPVAGEVRLSEGAKRAVQEAIEEARRTNQDHIGQEHLLVGLLGVEEGLAWSVLRSRGVTVDAVRAAVECALARREAVSAGVAGALMPGQPASIWASGESGTRRYNLALPEGLYQEVQQVAARQQTTVVEVIRRFIRLGLIATRVAETPGGALLVREGGKDREVLLL
jgi:ATP-dependent Clp protease ATP-binding subunit ClpA